MTEFTPTTAQVRDAYVRAMRNAFIASAGEHREEFDRWLAEDRAIAWEIGYHRGTRDEMQDLEAADNPYRSSEDDDADT